MTDLMHWHGQPSEVRQPPKCCTQQFERVQAEAVDEAARDAEERERDERRRIIADAVDQMEAYQRGLATITDEATQQLVEKVTSHCIDIVRRSACTCEPRFAVVSSSDGPVRYVPYLDPTCGAHGPSLQSTVPDPS